MCVCVCMLGVTHERMLVNERLMKLGAQGNIRRRNKEMDKWRRKIRASKSDEE